MSMPSTSTSFGEELFYGDGPLFLHTVSFLKSLKNTTLNCFDNNCSGVDRGDMRIGTDGWSSAVRWSGWQEQRE